MEASEGTIKRPRRPARRGAFSLGRFMGIPVFVDYSWLIIFLLLTVSVSDEFRRFNPEWPASHYLPAAVATSLLAFFSVFLHEIGHCVVARIFGLSVQSITLFIFGGVAHIRGQSRKPAHEFLMAIAGPLTSAALAVLFFLIAGIVTLSPEGLSAYRSVPWLLGIVNASLAIFNMIPGFPLDGGLALRSLVWALTGRFERATRFAAGVGSIVAYFFIAFGLFMLVFQQNILNGIWMIFIGGFLVIAARSSVMQIVSRRTLSKLRAIDVMERVPSRVSPAMSVQWLVEGPILQQGQNIFVVERDGEFRGLITRAEVKAVPRDERPGMPLQSIMIPASELIAVEPNAALDKIQEALDNRAAALMPVVRDGQVIGIVTREGLARVLQARMEFGE